MREFVRSLGFTWVVLAIIPLVTIIGSILRSFDVQTATIVAIQLPLLAIQISSLVIMVVYRKEIF